MALFDDVKNIIVEQLHVAPEKVTATAHFVDDLGADSLDIVELVMAFEEKFAVEIPDEDSQKLDQRRRRPSSISKRNWPRRSKP